MRKYIKWNYTVWSVRFVVKLCLLYSNKIRSFHRNILINDDRSDLMCSSLMNPTSLFKSLRSTLRTALRCHYSIQRCHLSTSDSRLRLAGQSFKREYPPAIEWCNCTTWYCNLYHCSSSVHNSISTSTFCFIQICWSQWVYLGIS